jgi:hypothetical protein
MFEFHSKLFLAALTAFAASTALWACDDDDNNDDGDAAVDLDGAAGSGGSAGQDGSTTDGSTTDGSTTDGSTTDGSTTDGDIDDGSATDGSTTDADVPECKDEDDCTHPPACYSVEEASCNGGKCSYPTRIAQGEEGYCECLDKEECPAQT